MYQQTILDSLAPIFGPDITWEQLSGLSHEDISTAFSGHYGLTEGDLIPSMFQTIAPEMMHAAMYKTYSPEIQATQQSLLPGLYKNLGGEGARQSSGGFAGSGGYKRQQDEARDVYGASMVDTLTKVRGQQTQGISNIQRLISDWHESAQNITYG